MQMWEERINVIKDVVFKLFSLKTPLSLNNYSGLKSFYLCKLYISIFTVLEMKTGGFFKYLLVYLKYGNKLITWINNIFNKSNCFPKLSKSVRRLELWGFHFSLFSAFTNCKMGITSDLHFIHFKCTI